MWCFSAALVLFSLVYRSLPVNAAVASQKNLDEFSQALQHQASIQ
jgi:hypothetical protein